MTVLIRITIGLSVYLVWYAKSLNVVFFKKINSFMSKKFPPYLCGFQKNHCANFLPSSKKWSIFGKKSLDKRDYARVTITDASKDF